MKFAAIFYRLPTATFWASAARRTRLLRQAMRGEPKGLPLSEILGVFLGVLGLQWLIDGQANVPLALGLALASGVLLLILRRLLRRKEE